MDNSKLRYTWCHHIDTVAGLAIYYPFSYYIICINNQFYTIAIDMCNYVSFNLLDLELQPGAAGFQMSNPPVLETVSLLASLNVSIYQL